MRAGQSLLQNTVVRRCAVITAVMVAVVLVLQAILQLWLPRGLDWFNDGWSADASVDDVSLRLFKVSPELQLHGLKLETEGEEPALIEGGVTVTISWWRLLTGEWIANLVTVDQADVALVVDAEGNSNVPAMLDALLELSSNDGSDPPVSRVRVGNVNIGYANQQLDQLGLLTLSGQANLENVDDPTTFSIDGVINGQSINAELNARFSNSDPLMEATADAELRIQLADTVLELAVSIAHVESLMPLDARLRIEGDSPGILLHALNVIEGPWDGPVDVSAVARLTDERLRLSSATARVGRSVGEADATITWNEERPHVEAQLQVESLFADDFISSGADTKTSVLNSSAKSDPAAVTEASEERFLSDQRLDVHDAIRAFDGSVQLTAGRFQQGGLTVTGLDLGGTLEAGALRITFDSDDLAQGELKGGLEYSVGSDGEGIGTLRMDARQIQVDQIAADSLFVEVMPSGVLTLAVDLEFAGNSVAGLASSLDGGIYLFVEEGQLDEFAVEMMGVDFLETARLLFIRDLQQIDISCGFIGLEANAGVLKLNPFVIDSDDTVFLAKGTIDLNTESLDLTAQSHARDTSWLTAETPIHVRGTLMAPKVRAGRKLYSRLAAAAALATVASPAAVLLPFIELGKSVDTSECESRLSTLQR